IPRLSPTSTASSPASSASRANTTSYAVRTAILSPLPLRARSAAVVTLTGASAMVGKRSTPAAPDPDRRHRSLAAAPVAGAGARVADDVDQLGAVLAVRHEVDVRGVHDEQRPFVVVEEEVGVGARDLLDVLGLDRLFGREAALADAVEQHVGARLQVDD